MSHHRGHRVRTAAHRATRAGQHAVRRRGSPPAYGAPREQDKLVDAPCPDLASPRPPTVPSCAERTVPKCSADGPPENHRLGSTFARIFDRPIDPRKGTKGRRKDDGEPGGGIKGALYKLGRIGRRTHSSADFKGRIPVIHFVQSRHCRRHRLDFATKPEVRRAESKFLGFRLAFRWRRNICAKLTIIGSNWRELAPA